MRPLRRPLRYILSAGAAGALVAVPFATATPDERVVLRVSISGRGTVSTSDGRLSCASDCRASYRRDAVVMLRAAALGEFSFARWSGGCVGTAASCLVSLDRATSVRATFIGAGIRLTVGGPGAVVSTSGGLACGGQSQRCANRFAFGATVTLTATAEAGARFETWGGSCQGSLPSCTLSVRDSLEVTAAFRHSPPSTGPARLSLLPAGSPITVDPPGTTCRLPCTVPFDQPTLVKLRTDGNSFWRFGCVGSGSVCEIVIDSPTRVEIVPPPPPAPPAVRVNVTVSGPGTVVGGEQIRCSGQSQTSGRCQGFFSGGVLLLRAVPLGNGRFLRWGGLCRPLPGQRSRCRVSSGQVIALFGR